jgi:serine/threonine protein kinase
MGQLYVGRSQAGTKVVIKEPLIKGNAEDAIRLEKLKVEGQILSQISHRNIVKFVDSMDDGRTYRLIIEFVPGKTLKDTYSKNPASETETKQHALTMLQALSYLHNMNIIHRDIKPQNVLLSNNSLILIDFGGAKYGYMQAPLSFGNTIVGTVGWTAPEQMHGITTPRCDIYGVGAIMFLLLTGEPPQYHTRSDSTVESPRKINPRISIDTDRIVLKALSFDPSGRYQIAEDMIKELQGYTVTQNTPCLFCRGTKYEIKNRLSIGRNGLCNIAINDNIGFVSKNHAVVYPDQGKYWIEDTQSTNGVFIYRNGVWGNRIQKSELYDGDLIGLCYRRDKGPYITLTFKKGN